MGMTANLIEPEATDASLMYSADRSLFSDAHWFRALTMPPRRPSLLVLCDAAGSEGIVQWLAPRCAQPVHTRILPEGLRLPVQKNGTLLLWDVATLTLRQQIELYDWMDGCTGDMQVVSITSAPLRLLVEDGQFLEGLFHRLNGVSIVAMQQRRAPN
jgi:Sigma-54 interaction domain